MKYRLLKDLEFVESGTVFKRNYPENIYYPEGNYDYTKLKSRAYGLPSEDVENNKKLFRPIPNEKDPLEEKFRNLLFKHKSFEIGVNSAGINLIQLNYDRMPFILAEYVKEYIRSYILEEIEKGLKGIIFNDDTGAPSLDYKKTINIIHSIQDQKAEKYITK